jgi:diguanylate cyclase (GGDEF)-like protein
MIRSLVAATLQRKQAHRAMIEITTKRQAVRHTMARVGVAVSVTLLLTVLMIISEFGIDPNVMVRVGSVMTSGIVTGVVIAGLLAGSLTYRSALVMRELNLARAELLRISRTDQLTGLLNRRAFDESAISILTTAKLANANTVAFMCDIDRFKAINDQFGHEFGDKVIAEIAGVFKAFAEQNGALTARHGGEEFAVLLVGVTVEQAMKHANTLRRACAATEISSGGILAYVTISIGVTVAQNPTDLSEIMRFADKALYAAKHRGRDRVARADVSESMAA